MCRFIEKSVPLYDVLTKKPFIIMEYPSTDIYYVIDKNGKRTVRKVRDDLDWSKEYPNKPKPYSCSYHNPPIAKRFREMVKKINLE